MKKPWFVLYLTAGLLLFPFVAWGEDYGSQPLQSPQEPPVAQPLVREGDFAIRLAEELYLGSPESEAEAEEVLAKRGIAPLNGWISDYPVTPAVLDQLRESLERSVAEGTLSMSAEEAIRKLYDLAAQMNLPVPEGPWSAGTPGPPSSTGQYGQRASPAVINNYYYQQGPPIITYYPPPPDYLYLYAWVPYPVWWFGVHFDGFFICHRFTTVVVVRSRTVIVSNRFIDPGTRTVVVVSPVVKTRTARPVTVLRTENGRTFRDLGELRRELRTGGSGAVTRGTSPSFNPPRPREFPSPEARRSAGAIYERSISGMRYPEGGISGREERRYTLPGSREERSSSGPGSGRERRYIAPNSQERAYQPPLTGPSGEPGRIVPEGRKRQSSGPGSSEERRYRTPHRPSQPPVRGGYGDAGRPFIAPSGPPQGGDRPVIVPGPGGRSSSGPGSGYERRQAPSGRSGSSVNTPAQQDEGLVVVPAQPGQSSGGERKRGRGGQGRQGSHRGGYLN